MALFRRWIASGRVAFLGVTPSGRREAEAVHQFSRVTQSKSGASARSTGAEIQNLNALLERPTFRRHQHNVLNMNAEKAEEDTARGGGGSCSPTGSADNVDQIREILFGPLIREY